MKKPKLETEEQQPRKIIRADKPPTEGYSLVVDGHFKSHHDTVEAAEEAGMALKNQYQMLQVQVYDAATKTRTGRDQSRSRRPGEIPDRLRRRGRTPVRFGLGVRDSHKGRQARDRDPPEPGQSDHGR